MKEELNPCPFCGGENLIRSVDGGIWPEHLYAEMIAQDAFKKYVITCTLRCEDCGASIQGFAESNDRAEELYYKAIEDCYGKWNRRTAVELDDFFYLPKPKQQLFGITTGLSFDDLGMKATGTIDAYAFTDAVLNWQAEMLNEKIVKRICEVWNPERTCHDTGESRWFCCSNCGCGINDIYLNNEAKYGVDARLRGCDDEFPYYCPYCGAKVVE